MRRGIVLAAAAAGWLSAHGPARAELITSAALMPGSGGLVTFSDQPKGYTYGPVQLTDVRRPSADIVYTGKGPSPGFSWHDYYLVDNGSWGANNFRYAFIDFGVGASIRFDFRDGPVSAVGGFMNYSRNGSAGNLVIEALGAGDKVLEKYDITAAAPISTPGGVNAGAFRGIRRDTEDILALRMTGGVGVIDDLTYYRSGYVPTVTAEAPEPAGLVLLAGGAVGLAGYACRRRRALRVA